MLKTLVSMLCFGIVGVIFLLVCGLIIYVLGDIYDEEENGRK